MTEQELVRGAARRLAIIRHAQEVTGNVSATCRYFGITRQAYYIWRRRYEEQGLDGLRDCSRRPRVSPNATKGEVVGKIVYLRQPYHFGPHKIAMYLKRSRCPDPNPPAPEFEVTPTWRMCTARTPTPPTTQDVRP